jgi:hypothetical protein
MKKTQDILSRMVAVFTVGALGTLGAGAIMGVETWVALINGWIISSCICGREISP